MKKYLPILIGVALAVGGGSFYGGMKYAQAKSPRGGLRAFAAGGGNVQFQGGPGGRTGGGRGMNGGFVGGEILSNDGKTLTLKLSTGGSKIVFLSDSTEISKSVSGAASDLEVGKNVMVIGKANDDGSVTAQTVQLRPDGMMVFTGGARPDGAAPAPKP